MKHLVIGQVEAEIHVPITVFNEKGGAVDGSVVVVAKVSASHNRVYIEDPVITSSTVDVSIESIKEALQQGWTKLSNVKKSESVQQACFAGL